MNHDAVQTLRAGPHLRGWRGKKKVLQVGNQDVLSQWDDSVETQGPTLVELNEIPDGDVANSLDDADRIPLSYFFDEQRKADIAWEFFISELKGGTKLGLNYNNDGDNFTVYVVTKFGWTWLGHYVRSTDTFTPDEPFTTMYPATVTGFVANGQFPEFSLIPQYFASDSAVQAFLEKYLRQYYALAKDTVNYKYFESPETGTVTWNGLWDAAKANVYRFCEDNGMFATGKKSKYSMTGNFNAEHMLNDLKTELELTSSEAAWPEIERFSTQYIDNLGIFIPTGYVVDQQLHYACLDAFQMNGGSARSIDVWTRCALLRKAAPYTTAQEYQNYNRNQLISRIPWIGQIAGAINAVSSWGQAQGSILYPKVYAFNRSSGLPMPSYNEIDACIGEYWSKVVQKNQGPEIQRPDKQQIQNMIQNLLAKGYIR